MAGGFLVGGFLAGGFLVGAPAVRVFVVALTAVVLRFLLFLFFLLGYKLVGNTFDEGWIFFYQKKQSVPVSVVVKVVENYHRPAAFPRFALFFYKEKSVRNGVSGDAEDLILRKSL